MDEEPHILQTGRHKTGPLALARHGVGDKLAYENNERLAQQEQTRQQSCHARRTNLPLGVLLLSTASLRVRSQQRA